MNFFGSRKKPAAASAAASTSTKSPAAAIGKIKEQIRVMEKSEAHLELRIKKLHASAVKKSKAKNKSGALLDLKRKKVLEKQLANKSNQRFALEQNCFALEVMHGNVETVKATKVANAAMASMTKAVGGIDNIEELHEDIQEHMDQASEISDLLGQEMGDGVDEDELEAEFNDLEAELLEESMMKTGEEEEDAFVLPAAPENELTPSHQDPVEEDEDADALAQLEAEMA